MKSEAQRIAIAESCGWEFPIDLPNQKAQFIGYPRFESGLGEDAEKIPDYLHDLNAMHEAENLVIIPNSFGPRYTKALAHICVREGFELALWNCTAAQRAEAFLKTIGKWAEECP